MSKPSLCRSWRPGLAYSDSFTLSGTSGGDEAAELAEERGAK